MSTVVMADTIPGYLTAEQAGQVIGVSRSQVSRYVSAGYLEARRIGQQLFIRERDVKKFRRPPRGNPQFVRRSNR